MAGEMRTHRQIAEDLLRSGSPVGAERASLTALAHALLALVDEFASDAHEDAGEAIRAGGAEPAAGPGYDAAHLYHWMIQLAPHAPEREVTRGEWIALERRASFNRTIPGYGPATSSWGAYGMRGWRVLKQGEPDDA